MWECFLAPWVFTLKFQLYGENVVQQVWKFNPQSPRKGNWGRSWEERKGSPVPIFPPPPNSRIVRLLTGWIEFCSEVSGLWVKRGCPLYELKREFYIELRVLLLTGFWVAKEAFIPYDTILMFWLGLLLFREEFGMLLAWFWK